MSSIDQLEKQSIYLIREAFARFKRPAILWSGGKDSTVMLWLCKKALFRTDFDIIHIDSGYKHKEVHEFRDTFAKTHDINIIVIRNEDAYGTQLENGTETCCQKMKTLPLKRIIAQKGYDGVLVGIRRDEHMIRSKERFFSKRDKQGCWNYLAQNSEIWNNFCSSPDKGEHIRVHPLLSWTEIDIWNYIKKEQIPVCNLYFSKNGRRFRTLGCMPCTSDHPSHAIDVDGIIKEISQNKSPEREGRNQDKDDEYQMQLLHSLGYM